MNVDVGLDFLVKIAVNALIIALMILAMEDIVFGHIKDHIAYVNMENMDLLVLTVSESYILQEILIMMIISIILQESNLLWIARQYVTSLVFLYIRYSAIVTIF